MHLCGEFQILSWTSEYLNIFDYVYMSYDVKIALSDHGLGNIYLIAFVGTGQRSNQSYSNIHDGTFDKSS